MANGSFNIQVDPTTLPSVIDTIRFPDTSGITPVNATPSLFSNLNFGNLLGSLVDTGLQTAGIQNQQQALREFGAGALEGMERIGAQAREDASFKPFTVTSTLGNVTTTPEGGINIGLSPEQQALQNTLFSGASNLATAATQADNPLFNQLAQQAYGGVSPLLAQAQTAAQAVGAMDRPAREQEIFDRLRAIQTEDERNARISLENRLAGQGRLGLLTSQFGGSPELLALEKAQADARNRTALAAMQQSAAEETRDINLAKSLQDLTGGMFNIGTTASTTPMQLRAGDLANLQTTFGLGYAPETQRLGALSPATNIAALADAGRREGAGLFGESSVAGLEAALTARLKEAELEQNLLQALAESANASAQTSGGLFDFLGGALGRVFGQTKEEQDALRDAANAATATANVT